jgi:hypothetical protein
MAIISAVGLACNMSAATAEASLAFVPRHSAGSRKSPGMITMPRGAVDLLDEGDDFTGLMDAEAIADGQAVLADLYGSTPALAEMKSWLPEWRCAKRKHFGHRGHERSGGAGEILYGSGNACGQHG